MKKILILMFLAISNITICSDKEKASAESQKETEFLFINSKIKAGVLKRWPQLFLRCLFAF